MAKQRTNPVTGERLWTAREVETELGISRRSLLLWTTVAAVRLRDPRLQLHQGQPSRPRDWFYMRKNEDSPSQMIRVYTEQGVAKLRQRALQSSHTRDARRKRKQQVIREAREMLVKLQDDD